MFSDPTRASEQLQVLARHSQRRLPYHSAARPQRGVRRPAHHKQRVRHIDEAMHNIIILWCTMVVFSILLSIDQ